MFLRQLGFEKFISITKGLNEYYEDLRVSKKFLEEEMTAWKSRRIVTPERRVDGRTSLGYPKWQSTRGKGYRIPPFEGPSRLINETMEDVRQEVNAQHEVLNESLNARVVELIQRKRKLEEILDTKGHDMKTLEKENKKLRSQLQLTKGVVNKLRDERDSLEEFKDAAREQIVDQSHVIRNLNTRVEELKGKDRVNRDRLTRSREEHIAAMRKMTKEIDTLRKEVAEWGSRNMKYHSQAENARDYALGMRNTIGLLADGIRPRDEQVRLFYEKLRRLINGMISYEGLALWPNLE